MPPRALTRPDRQKLRVYRAIVKAEAGLTPEARALHKQRLTALMETTFDDRVRFNCIKLLADLEQDAADREWEEYTHNNPAVQKVEHSGTVSIAQQIIEAHAKRKAVE